MSGPAGEFDLRSHVYDSDELLSKAFALSQDYVAIVRASDRTLIQANDAICRLWGSTPQAVIGKPTTLFTTWLDEDARAGFMRTLAEKGECLDVETSLRLADGQQRRLSVSSRMITVKGERCILSVMRDVTASRQAEAALRASEERYHSILESIFEGCQLLDFHWHYLYLNNAAAVQNRRPNSELLGREMTQMWPGIEHTAVYAMLKRCMEGRCALQMETEFVFPDGHSGWFDVRGQPVAEGIFVLSIDITQRKNAELKLRDLNETLELKVAERTAELQTARLHAEAADRLKSAFLATMSHELRTPLNSIIGFTGIMRQELAGPINPTQAKHLGIVLSSARRLLGVINDVLDLSKIEAGEMEVEIEPFAVREAIAAVVAIVQPLADAKAIAIDVVFPAAVRPMTSDRRRIEQILINLLGNAVKFTETGSITVTLDFPERDDGGGCNMRIRVRDTGVGIPQRALDDLFQPFRQLDSGFQRKREGSGLGLAICRRLATLLGGEINVESVPGEGSTFTLLLPADVASSD